MTTQESEKGNGYILFSFFLLEKKAKRSVFLKKTEIKVVNFFVMFLFLVSNRSLHERVVCRTTAYNFVFNPKTKRKATEAINTFCR